MKSTPSFLAISGLVIAAMLAGTGPTLAEDTITIGFTAFVLLIPLAATSTAGMIRRLGKRWQMLHRLIYVSAAAGVIHF